MKKMNYIYNLKKVSTAQEYLDAVDEGYVDIQYPKEIEKDINHLLRASKHNNADFSYLYAVLLMDEDRELESVAILKSLIRKNNPRAMLYLGQYYNERLKDRKFIKKGRKYVKKAAKLGYVPAYNICGIMNIDGDPYNYDRQVRWYRLAAEKGFAVAQYNLGLMLENGIGVAKNMEEAEKWYTLASNQGLDVGKKVLQKLQEKNKINNLE